MRRRRKSRKFLVPYFTFAQVMREMYDLNPFNKRSRG